MSFVGLPPGNILQNMYLNERLNFLLSTYKYKTFLEIGSGNGHISHILLNKGLDGIGIDLNLSACTNNKQKNIKFIRENKYTVLNEDFFEKNFVQKFDIIISYMVIEHMNVNEQQKFFEKVKNLLSPNGVIIIQVPANNKFWNIEDETAGHQLRFEQKDIYDLCYRHHLVLHHFVGLNYPLSNWLFSISNYLIKKQEKEILNLSEKERTIYTGNRQVKFKTTFPKFLNIILNPVFLYPFHICQKIFLKNYDNSLIFYAEFKIKENETIRN